MIEKAEAIDTRLQNAVDLGISGIDIMQAIEDETEEAMDSMERKYWEGMLDAYVHLYRMTYDLSFAIGARDEA